jgi:hypothetical protein
VQRLTASTALANNGGLPRGPPFVMNAAAPTTCNAASSATASIASERPRRDVRPSSHRGSALDDHQVRTAAPPPHHRFEHVACLQCNVSV